MSLPTASTIMLLDAACVARHASRALALAAVREAFIALASGASELFPVAVGHGADEGSMVTLKAGLHGGNRVGLKVGTYWPGNTAQGIPNHGATTLLLDPATGRPEALLNVSHLNGLRTAAADAAAAQVLAHEDAQTVAIVGAGHQALFELRALCDVRPIRRVCVWSRNPQRAADFVAALQADPPPGLVDLQTCATPEQAVREADIVVTATTSRAPLFDAAAVRPGTHVAAMGADRAGKQELPLALLRTASLFADHPPQSVQIGEFQHVVGQGLRPQADIGAIGDVLAGRQPGRRSADEVTVFDSSGLAAQDIAVALAVLAAARAAGDAAELLF